MRDPEWERGDEVVKEFQDTIRKIDEIVRADQSGELIRSRLRNQADFYSLVGAICTLNRSGQVLHNDVARDRIHEFISIVENEARRGAFASAQVYFAASRAASNDAGPRQTRINVMSEILLGLRSVPQA